MLSPSVTSCCSVFSFASADVCSFVFASPGLLSTAAWEVSISTLDDAGASEVVVVDSSAMVIRCWGRTTGRNSGCRDLDPRVADRSDT